MDLSFACVQFRPEGKPSHALHVNANQILDTLSCKRTHVVRGILVANVRKSRDEKQRETTKTMKFIHTFEPVLVHY